MKCPSCKSPLREKGAGEITLDLCYGGCGGIWFDAAELERVSARAATTLHTILYQFIPDAAKPGTGGKSILSVNGKKVAEGHIPKTQPFMFSADEGADVGLDGETNVANDYQPGPPSALTGRNVKVTVEQK